MNSANLNLSNEEWLKSKAHLDNMNTAQQRMKAQAMNGHLILSTAYIGKGRKMKVTGAKDYTLLYKDKAYEEFKKKIGGIEPTDTIYVEVWYYTADNRLGLHGILPGDEFDTLPKEWKDFIKFLSPANKKRAGEK